MKNLIFSVYIDIPDENLEKDLGPLPGANTDIERTITVKNSYQEYHSRLIENHREYANSIGVDYIPFGRDPGYMEFYETWKNKFPFIPEYHFINFYQFYLLEKLTKEYDKVLSLDIDVAFNTDKNFFDSMTEGLHIYSKDLTDVIPKIVSAGSYNLHRRAPTAKWFLVKAMCLENFISFPNYILNSGVMAADNKTMKQLDYMNNLEDCLNLIKKLKEDKDCMFPKRIQDTFDWNNEVIATYLSIKNNVPIINTDGPWNYHERRVDKEQFDKDTKYLIHFIMKNFNWFFGG